MARIHIFGASGSGTTTLGKALGSSLRCSHFDSDNYYWLPTDPPFRVARESQVRLRLLLDDLGSHDSWVLSGSLCGWGDATVPLFDLAVFLWIPQDIRLARLKSREIERYGEEIARPGGTWCKHTREFFDWAAMYDTGGPEIRSRARHENWMASLHCPLLRLEGDIPVSEKAQRVIAEVAIINGNS